MTLLYVALVVALGMGLAVAWGLHHERKRRQHH